MCITITDKFIDPFTDFGFKRIFGTEENKRFLISFLNDLLDLEDDIVDIEYRNLEKLGLSLSDRKAIYDIYCTDTKKNKFIVELQRSQQKYFKDRSLYYTTFPIQEQSEKGTWDYELKRVYFVGILDFCIDGKKEDGQYLKKVQLKDEKNELFYEKLTYYYIQIPKFEKKESELSTHLDYWLYYLGNLADMKKIPKVLKEDALLKEAFDVAEFLALSKDQQFSYQQDLKHRLDNKNIMDYAKEQAEKKGLEEGVQKGLKEGLKEGVEKGLKEGIEKGLKEGVEKGRKEMTSEMVIKLNENKIPIDQIMAMTEVSENEIKIILKSHLSRPR